MQKPNKARKINDTGEGGGGVGGCYQIQLNFDALVLLAI